MKASRVVRGRLAGLVVRALSAVGARHEPDVGVAASTHADKWEMERYEGDVSRALSPDSDG